MKIFSSGLSLPKIHGIIDRRILINYRVPPEVTKKLLPAPFEPLVVNGSSIVGICLIRLREMRPVHIPSFLGFSSENAAHRFAVKWVDSNGIQKNGVYVPRRDTSSPLLALAGGRLFPGIQNFSKFQVNEPPGSYKLSFKNRGKQMLKIECQESGQFPESSIFPDLETASAFFQRGSLGYSPDDRNRFHGIELETTTWEVSPLETTSVDSAFFSDKKNFPTGSVIFDNALLMKNIDHKWVSHSTMP